MFLFLAASLVDANHQCHASNQSDFLWTVSYPSLVDIVKFVIIIIIIIIIIITTTPKIKGRSQV